MCLFKIINLTFLIYTRIISECKRLMKKPISDNLELCRQGNTNAFTYLLPEIDSYITYEK